MKVYVLLYIGGIFSELISRYLPKATPSVASLCFEPFEKKLQIYVFFILMDFGKILWQQEVGVAGGWITVQNYMVGDSFAHANGGY